MDSTILATRRAIAINRVVELSTALANRLELDPVLVDALQPAIKDPQVKELRRLEALGDVLLALAISAGAVKEQAPAEEPLVTTVTDDISQPVENEDKVPVLEAKGKSKKRS